MNYDEPPGYYSLRTSTIPTGTKQFLGYVLEPLEIRRNKGAYLSQDTSKEEEETFGASNSKEAFQVEDIRKKYVFKLFALLSCEFLFLLLVIYIFSSIEVIETFTKSTPLMWKVSGGGALLFFLLLSFIEPLRRIRPLNSVILWFMVCFMAVCIASITIRNELIVVIYSFAMETAVAVFITVLAKFAPCDVAGCAMIFCVIGTLLAVFSLVTSLIWLITKYSIFDLLIGGGSMILLTVYLLFSTQVMIDNNTISPDEIVRGNIHLYVGCILLMIYAIMILVRLCRKKK